MEHYYHKIQRRLCHKTAKSHLIYTDLLYINIDNVFKLFYRGATPMRGSPKVKGKGAEAKD
jgi:hypothetical protein